jgi:hypothetical protein
MSVQSARGQSTYTHPVVSKNHRVRRRLSNQYRFINSIQSIFFYNEEKAMPTSLPFKLDNDMDLNDGMGGNLAQL